MKKRLFSLITVISIGLSLVGCNGNAENCGVKQISEETDNQMEEIVVGFSQVGAESDWRIANTESMKSTFTTENGYKLIYNDAQQKQENQIRAILKFIQQEVDYIVIAPVRETGWESVLDEAKRAGIPVIIVDRMIDVEDQDLFTAWVGSDFRNEGEKAVCWMEREFNEKEHLNIVHIQGTIGSSAQIGRTEGLEAGLKKHKNWCLLAQETGEFTQAKSQEVMETILQKYDDIDLVYCENDNEAFGVIKAIEAAGKTCGRNGDIQIISFDATNAGLRETLWGKISYNVECNPMHGPRVEKIIQQLEKGEIPDKYSYVEEEVFDSKTITEEVILRRAY